MRSVIFSVDSQIFFSSSDDRAIKLWDVQTGRCINTVAGDRLYERMNIQDATELTTAQRATLKALGAVELAVSSQTSLVSLSLD